MDNICKNLCEAVRIIIEGDKQNNPPQYDVTKDCTVVDVKNKHKGRYGVSDGSSTFEACAAAGASYTLGDVVLVTIPQGNYNNQKTILNKVITEAVDAIGYVSPLDNFIKGSGNLITTKQVFGITANGVTTVVVDEKEIQKPLLMKKIWDLQKSDGLYFGFTRVAIVADFMTLLSSQNVIKGEYGLKLMVYGDKPDLDSKMPVAELTFSASEMLGNIYNFNSYFKQEAVFTIPSNINSIKKMELYLYQDGAFKDGNDELLDPIEVNNIFVNNIEVYLGYQGDYASQEVVQIACSDLTYDNESLSRYLALRWLHKIDQGVFEPITNANFNKQQHEVRWYKYVSGCSQGEIDEYGGKNWQLLNKNDIPIEPTDWPEETEFPPADYPFVLPVFLNKNQTTEKFKVVTIVKEYPLINDPTYVETKYYDSNILEFNNVEESTNGGTQPPEQKPDVWSLHFHDNSFGNYFMYDQNGQLIDGSNQSSKKRVVELYYKGEELSNYPDYSAIKYIKWEVPAKSDNSMLIYSENYGVENPKENIVGENYQLGTPIAYSNVGEFDYSAKITVPKNDKKERVFDEIKILLYTTPDSDVENLQWEKVGHTPHSCTAMINSDEVDIKTQFTINREYKYFKILYKYYKDEEEIDISTIPNTVSSNHNFELSSIFHTGTVVPSVDNEGNKTINTKFEYTIASNWNRSRNNNTIKCTIDAEGWSKPIVISETLRFGQKGTSGTANTFILEMLDGKNALLAKKGEKLRIEALLINANGQLVSLLDAAKEGKIEWEIINHNAKHMSTPAIVKSGTDDTPIVEITCNRNSIPSNNYAILQAKYEYPVQDEESGTTPCLYAFLPIPMKTENALSMSGPDRIIYNHMGQPRCGDDSYIAFGNSGTERYYWKISQPTQAPLNPNPVTLKDSGTIQTTNQADDPRYEGTLKCGLTLNPSPLYATIDGDERVIQDAVCVYCYGTGSNGSAGPLLWSQPILIMQSNYDFAMLNSWNGDLKIDEENGTILATMLGVGKKKSDNKFSGVLIGDIQGGTGLQDTTTLTGVYGFQDGVITYGLQENGMAFFGAKANGRIEINGQHGAIHSYGWTPEYKTNYTKWTLDKASKGSVFDLDDGQLQLYADTNNYLKYNDNNSGKLEMSLSGANIKLTDKANKNLSGYIDVTAKGLTSEFRRTATYTATCATKSSNYNKSETDKGSPIKELVFKNLNSSFSNETNNKDDTINKVSYEDILTDGVTIAVTFTWREVVNEEKKSLTNSQGEQTGTRIVRTGYPLYLTIRKGTNDLETYKRPIYINSAPTNNTPTYDNDGKVDNDARPFGWEKGSTIYFTYSGTQSGGHWEVTDSGSYSRITQTADMICSEVSTIGGNLSSKITQTATSITSEVRRTAGYSCTATKNENNTYWQGYLITIQNPSNSELTYTDILQQGVAFDVMFDSDEQSQKELWAKIKVNDSTSEWLAFKYKDAQVTSTNPFTWKAGDTIHLLYQSASLGGYSGHLRVVDSGSYSKIAQTADTIRSEVTDALGNYSTTTQTATMISNQISGKLDETGTFGSCGWSITTNGFNIYKNVNNVTTNLFNVDTSGNATFSGALSAVTGTFDKLAAGVTHGNYTTTLTSNYLQLAAEYSSNVTYIEYGTIDSEDTFIALTTGDNAKELYRQGYNAATKQYYYEIVVAYPGASFVAYETSVGSNSNTYGGVIRIGAPDNNSLTSWNDVTMYAIPTLNSDNGRKSYGNIGSPSHYWDTFFIRSITYSSERDIKYDIQNYNIDQAYSELQTLPIYTFYYQGHEDKAVTNALKIGTMIDYIPAEVMSTKSYNNKEYDLGNLVFWNIAATQAMSHKLENALMRLDQLEIKE